MGSGGEVIDPGSGGTTEPMGSGGLEPGGGGSGAPMGCADDEKLCGGICVKPAPTIGCGLDDCRACPPAPTNATGTCQGDVCAWECKDGFEQMGAACVVPGAGGSTGAGGASGGAGAPPAGGVTCGGQACPPCDLTGPLQCCSGSQCGCTWFPVYCST